MNKNKRKWASTRSPVIKAARKPLQVFKNMFVRIPTKVGSIECSFRSIIHGQNPGIWVRRKDLIQLSKQITQKVFQECEDQNDEFEIVQINFYWRRLVHLENEVRNEEPEQYWACEVERPVFQDLMELAQSTEWESRTHISDV